MSQVSAVPAVAAPYLPALTGIRAVAAYLVFLHHFNPFPAEGPGAFWHSMLLEFHIGVPIFFVLSGFLITLRYADTMEWTGAWWRGYLRNRIARIYPLYFLLTCLTFWLVYRAEGQFDPVIWLANVLFLRGFFANLVYSGIPQGWTLTVEECFYLFAPVVFLVLRRRPSLTWLLPLALALVGAGLVVICAPIPWYGPLATFRFMLLFTFFGRAVEFFAGIQLARWYCAGRLSSGGSPYPLTVGGLLLITAVLGGMVALQGEYDYGQEHPFGIVLNNLALPGGIVLLFAGLLTESTWLRWLLSTRLLQILGKSSYAFYLIHYGPLEQFIQQQLPSNDKLLQSVLLFGLLNALAILLHYLLEQPLNQWLRRPRAVTRAAVA